MKRLIRSFFHASEGIVYSIRTQRNMKIHVSFALAVLLMGMAFHFNNLDTTIILMVIGMVLSAETFNTAIEITVDLITDQYHQLAKYAKDLAAGAVLLIAIIATTVGAIVIFPYVKIFLTNGWAPNHKSPISFFSMQIIFIIIITYIIKAFWKNRNNSYQPNVLIGVLLFFVSLLFVLHIFYLYYVFIITIVIVFILKMKNIVSLQGIIQNVFISMVGFYLLYWLLF